MTKNNINTLYTYFIIYAIAQGIMDAYEEAIETPYLKRAGLDLGWIGIMQSIDFIPWCVKFLFAIPTDSYDFFGWGHRRPYVVMGLVIATGAFIALGFLDPAIGTGTLYMLAMIVRNSGIAISDCAVNGLSVDAAVDSESGTLSGWMSLGRTIGTVMCCCIAGVISREFGYKWGIVASGVFVVIPLPANYFIVEEWTDAAAFKDKIEGAAVAATGAVWKPDSSSAGSSPVSPNDKSIALLAGLAAGGSSGSSTPTPKALPVWEAPLPFPDAAKPKGWEGGSSRGAGGEAGEEERGVDPKVAAARKMARRPSFIQRIAESAGFDWALLMELLAQRHVWMFLLYICFTTLGVAVANFSLAAWLESEHAFEADKIGFAMSAMSVGCFVASLPLGYLFDYLPYKRAMLFLAAASCAGANLTLAFCKTENEAYWGLVFFGAAHGAIFVVQCSMARILADSRVAGVLFGIVDSCCNSMHLLGTAFTGYIATHFTTSCEDHQNWLHPQGFCEPAKPTLPTGCQPNNTWHTEEQIKEGMLEWKLSPEGQHPILWCDYNLTFYVATVIDVWAILFVFLIPGDKLRVEEGHELKVLPHRANPIFAEQATRKTAMNTTATQLLSGEIDGTARGGGSRLGESALSVGPPPPADGMLYGIEVSQPLRAFLTEGGGGLTGAASQVYVPPGGAPPDTVTHSLVHTAALQSYGLVHKPLPPDAPLSSHLLASLTTSEPVNRRAPRRASAGDGLLGASALGASGGSSSYRNLESSGLGSAGAGSFRKNSVAAAQSGEPVSTTGSMSSFVRPGAFGQASPQAASALAFEAVWENADRAQEAGSGSSSSSSSSSASASASTRTLKAAPRATDAGAPSMSMVNPLRNDGGGAQEWKPKHR